MVTHVPINRQLAETRKPPEHIGGTTVDAHALVLLLDVCSVDGLGLRREAPAKGNREFCTDMGNAKDRARHRIVWLLAELSPIGSGMADCRDRCGDMVVLRLVEEAAR